MPITLIQPRVRSIDTRRGYSEVVLAFLAATAALAVGQAVSALLKGDSGWYYRFFQNGGTQILAGFAVAGAWMCVRVWHGFEPNEPMYRAWRLISLAAGLDVLSAIFAQVVAAAPGWSRAQAVDFQRLGLSLGGTLRFALLAAGLAVVLGIFRQARFLAPLRPLDWALLAAFGVYVTCEFWDLGVAMRAGRRPDLAEILHWPVDPLLGLLSAQALRLRRTIQHTGGGWIGRCWTAFGIAIFFTALGDVAIWAETRGYFPSPWSAITWYIWFPAAAAFAMAPAYQLDAMQRASVEVRPVHFGRNI
jgi:hypothetical protein